MGKDARPPEDRAAALMALEWAVSARRDLERLHNLLASVSPNAALKAVRLILAGVRRLAAKPRLGARMIEFEPREIRRLFVADYEVRYEVRDGDLFILRVWHVREDR